jgi:hypothetical protein
MNRSEMKVNSNISGLTHWLASILSISLNHKIFYISVSIYRIDITLVIVRQINLASFNISKTKSHLPSTIKFVKSNRNWYIAMLIVNPQIEFLLSACVSVNMSVNMIVSEFGFVYSNVWCDIRMILCQQIWINQSD